MTRDTRCYAPATEIIGANGTVYLCTCMACGAALESFNQDLHSAYHDTLENADSRAHCIAGAIA